MRLLLHYSAVFYLLSTSTAFPVTMTSDLKDLLPLDLLASTANAYCSAKGIQVERKNDDGSSYFQSAPVSLLPNAYPETAFEQAVQVATNSSIASHATPAFCSKLSVVRSLLPIPTRPNCWNST